jgi:hypothetical protein
MEDTVKNYVDISATAEVMPGFSQGDRIIVITDSGRTNGILHAASTSGITFTCEHGLRFRPWTAIRAVNLVPEGAGEKA